MFSALARWLFGLSGWKIAGNIPHIPKGIWVVAPHATNWDFPVGVGVRAELRIWIQYLAKSQLFTWYAGWFFRILGGKPVYRNKANNLVDAIVDILNSNEQLHVCITPEGTRSNVSKLKTGFYYIGLKANVPLILTGFDYPRKLVILSEPMYMTGNYEQDMRAIYDFFLQVQGVRKDWLQHYAETGEIS